MNAEVFWLTIGGIMSVLTLTGSIIANFIKNTIILTSFMTKVEAHFEANNRTLEDIKDEMKSQRVEQSKCVQQASCLHEMAKHDVQLRDLWEKKADKK